MANFLLCTQPITLEELENQGIVFNLFFAIHRFNIPKIVYHSNKVESYIKEISQYENLLANIQLYNPFILGLEITNAIVNKDYFVIAIGNEGIELGYANHKYERIKILNTKGDNDIFIKNKIKNLNEV